MMTLSRFQEPPRGLGASARIVTGPADAGIFFKWASAKNPRNLPSGDQKGKAAPSVPSSFLAASSFRDCTQSVFRSFWFREEKAMAVPSGVMTGGPAASPVKSNWISGGGGKKARK